MSGAFDPYYTWLGIPPEEQPPTYYRLLGIRPFEHNADVIAHAADRQMAHLRTFQSGARAAESQRLLNEVAAARICLLHPERKIAYDAELQARLAPQVAAPPPVIASPPVVATLPIATPPQVAAPPEVVAPPLVTAPPSPMVPPPQVAAPPQVVAPPPIVPAPGLDAPVAAPLSIEALGPPATPVPAMRKQIRWHVAGWFLAGSMGLASSLFFILLGLNLTRPTKGILVFDWTETEWRDAAVEIDDQPQPIGDSGEFEIALRPGEHRVRVSRPWCDPFDRVLSIGPGQRVPLTVKLKPMSGLLIFDLLPADRQGMTLEIDGQPRSIPVQGSLRVRLDSGAHEVRLARPGHEDVRQRVTLSPGQELAFVPRWRMAAPPPQPLPEKLEMRADAAPSKEAAKPDTAKTEPPKLTAFKPPAPQGRRAAKAPAAKKAPVPSEAAQEAALAALQGLHLRQAQGKPPHVVLPLAAKAIRTGRESEGKLAEQFVAFRAARDAAAAKGDCLLPLLAIREMDARFEIDAGEMRRAAILGAANRARSALAADVVAGALRAELAEAVESDQYEAWLQSIPQLEKSLRKVGGTAAGEAIVKKRKELDLHRKLYLASVAAEKTLQQNPDDPAANWEVGRFQGLVKEDWEQALPRLVKGKPGPLTEAAKRLVADPTEADGQAAFGDAWWDLVAKADDGTSELVRNAAWYWYGQAMPRLIGPELTKILQRINPPAQTRASSSPPYTVPLQGVGGLTSMAPSKTFGAVTPQGGFATIDGQCNLDYPPVPTSNYVHLIDLTFTKPKGFLSLVYGDVDDGARIEFSWDEKQKKYFCRIQYHSGNAVSGGGREDVALDERLNLMFYVNASQHKLYQEEKFLGECGGHPTDLRFRLSTRGQTATVIHRCEFRPWIRADAVRLSSSAPPTAVEGDPQEAAFRLYDRSQGLLERPIAGLGKPYLLLASGTVMQWIAPGNYSHPVPRKKDQRVQINISRGFWIGRYEITQAEWMAIMPENPSRVTGSPFLPVDSVKWEDVGSFCLALNQAESKAKRLPPGYVYRLPTEAEWEYACRAGESEAHSVKPEGFWAAENSLGRPHEVGEGLPNAWGLYDMHGNVPEWCLDAFREEPDNPHWKLDDPFSPAKEKNEPFVLRGGGWWNERTQCSSATRDRSRSIPGGYRGFRIVLAPAVK